MIEFEEEVKEPSSNYKLVINDENTLQISKEFIFETKTQKGIHSVKFNHNDQYIAAGNLNFINYI
jgi:hypothetical protein